MLTLLQRGLALMLLILPACALDLASLQPQGYVSDFAKVVDPASRSRLEQYSKQLETATGAQLALVTLPTLDGEPVEDVANTLFRQWGIGQKGKDEGLLLLLVVRDRRSRLEVGRGLEPIITDGTSGGLLREMRVPLRAGDYGEALTTAARSLGGRIASAKGVELGAGQSLPRPSPPAGEGIPWPMLLGGALLLLWIMSMGRGSRYRGARGGGIGDVLAGMVLGQMMSRGRHGGYSGSGGFGGYDSGDSFGGFGGGDSGGGGASGDW